MKVWMGIDCGSASVKIAIINEKEELINSVYLRNKGLIETVKESLGKIANDNYEVKGVGITGSGREFTKMLIGGDLIKTEVFTHVIGVLKYYPDAKIISDIGGEDSKLMIIDKGILSDFILNNSCSSGTGSSLESIAIRLGVPIEDVGDFALRSTKKLNISTKCGVFMTSASVTFLNNGEKKEDILMGVIRGMVGNYLVMAQGKNLQTPHIYTGMTAKNKAIVKAFNEQLGYEIIVPEHAPIMGAIGSALIVKREGIKKSNFKGFNIKDINYKTKLFISNGCDNHCEITLLYDEKTLVGCIGNRCEKCVPESLKNK